VAVVVARSAVGLTITGSFLASDFPPATNPPLAAPDDPVAGWPAGHGQRPGPSRLCDRQWHLGIVAFRSDDRDDPRARNRCARLRRSRRHVAVRATLFVPRAV